MMKKVAARSSCWMAATKISSGIAMIIGCSFYCSIRRVFVPATPLVKPEDVQPRTQLNRQFLQVASGDQVRRVRVAQVLLVRVLLAGHITPDQNRYSLAQWCQD